MVVSGIVVACRPGDIGSVSERIDALPWGEVHHCDPNGRLIVVIEAEDTEESMARLKRVQALPHVLMAELGAYYLDEAAEG